MSDHLEPEESENLESLQEGLRTGLPGSQNRLWEALHKKYDKRVERWVRRLVGRKHANSYEDVAQEVWLKIGRPDNLIKLDLNAPEPFLKVVARNVFIDFYRRTNRLEKSEVSDDQLDHARKTREAESWNSGYVEQKWRDLAHELQRKLPHERIAYAYRRILCEDMKIIISMRWDRSLSELADDFEIRFDELLRGDPFRSPPDSLPIDTRRAILRLVVVPVRLNAQNPVEEVARGYIQGAGRRHKLPPPVMKRPLGESRLGEYCDNPRPGDCLNLWIRMAKKGAVE